jgi:hypothetical protein
MHHSLSVGPLAGVLHEMEYRLLARVLQVMGQEHCRIILADAVLCAPHGGMPGGTLPWLATLPYLSANTVT